MLFLLVDFGLCYLSTNIQSLFFYFKEILSCLIRSNFYISSNIFYYLSCFVGSIIHIKYFIWICQFYIFRLLFSTKTLSTKFVKIARSCHIQVHLSGKLHPRSDATSEPYKPAFHGGHLSRNTSYGSAATLWVFCLPRQRYFYSTQSSMTELLLSVSQHWNLCLG